MKSVSFLHRVRHLKIVWIVGGDIVASALRGQGPGGMRGFGGSGSITAPGLNYSSIISALRAEIS